MPNNWHCVWKGFRSIISCVSRVVSTDFSSWHSTKAAWSQTSPSLHTQVVFLNGLYPEISSKVLPVFHVRKNLRNNLSLPLLFKTNGDTHYYPCSLLRYDCKSATFILLTFILLTFILLTFILLTWSVESCSPWNNTKLGAQGGRSQLQQQ